MKNSILLPTDFSENAWVATNYAAELANKFNFDLHILHVYQTFGKILGTAEFNEVVAKHNEDAAFSEMDKWEQKVKTKYPQLQISFACMEGNLTDTVLKVAEENHVAFIVMGTKGEGGFKGYVLGSNTFELIQHSPIGVIAVPQDYKEFKFQKVGILTNFKNQELELLESFINRTSPGLDLTLLHVTENGRNIDTENILFWQDRIVKQMGINSIEYRSKEMINRIDINEPIPYIINQMIADEGINILLVTYTRKSFFASLFSKDLAKTIANGLSIPTYFLKN